MTLTEAFLKPVLVKLARFAVREYVPEVIDRLDVVLPQWIVEYTPDELREKCFDVISTVSEEKGEPVIPLKSEVILDAVVSTYSFLANASKVGKIG